MDEIAALRRRIDELDLALVTLLNQRANCALAIGHEKDRLGLPVYQPTREGDVLANVRRANRGPLDDGAITRLFERIIDEARRLERQAASARSPGESPAAGTVESE
jgi:chorismate mutase